MGGFVNVVDRGIMKWRPEPFSVARVQSEQPLVHYASATFWDWPAQRRQFEERRMANMNRRASGAGGSWGRRASNASGGSDIFDPDLPRAPVGLAPPGLAGKRWQGRDDSTQKQPVRFDEKGKNKRSRMGQDGLYPVEED